MREFPKKLLKKLSEREADLAIRSLPKINDMVDLSSNDYLGFARNETIFHNTEKIMSQKNMVQNGASGSRLLSGNHELYDELEGMLAKFHKTEAALVFNSGYDANIGFFGSVPQRGDVIFYDAQIHASIRDGITMGNAKSYKFEHNNVEDLKNKWHAERNRGSEDAAIYVVTESVFSMDGDSPDLKAFVDFCELNDCNLVVDEAHALGIFGHNGAGLVQELGVEQQIFARIVTFGKAMGCHGAAILGSKRLITYLINFARSLIYTTGLPPHSIATILAAYRFSKTSGAVEQRQKLKENIAFFYVRLKALDLLPHFITSNSAIHCCMVQGNQKVRKTAQELQEKGFDVKPIMAPTIPMGEERLRFCLHSFNTKEEIGNALKLLASYL